jgi:hypothetical protein
MSEPATPEDDLEFVLQFDLDFDLEPGVREDSEGSSLKIGIPDSSPVEDSLFRHEEFPFDWRHDQKDDADDRYNVVFTRYRSRLECRVCRNLDCVFKQGESHTIEGFRANSTFWPKFGFSGHSGEFRATLEQLNVASQAGCLFCSAFLDIVLQLGELRNEDFRACGSSVQVVFEPLDMAIREPAHIVVSTSLWGRTVLDIFRIDGMFPLVTS